MNADEVELKHEDQEVDGMSEDENEDGRRVRRRVSPGNADGNDQGMHDGSRGAEERLPTPAFPGEPVDSPAPEVEEVVPPVPEVHPVHRPPRVRALPKPIEPTRKQREIHELTHYPFESWCRHCVRCKASNAPHRSLHWHAQGEQVPVVSADFAFLGQRDQESITTLIVLRDRLTRKTFAHVLQGKSTSRETYSDYVVNVVCRDLDSLSYGKPVFKTDQEPATLALQDRVRVRREKETLLENSPVAEHQSNGEVERANRDIEDQARTLKDALEERLNETLLPTSPALPWLVEHAAWLYNHCHEGMDGMTTSEREKGAKSTQPIAEFGESVLYRPLRGEAGRESEKHEKFEARLEDGIFLGIEDRSGEARIGTVHGVVKCRDFRRKPESERWSAEAVRRFAGTPWDPSPQGGSEFSGAPVGNPLDPRPRVVEESEPGMSARRVRLTREDFEVHGYTDTCDGCRQLRLGRPPRGHNERCRTRMEAAISEESEEGRLRVEAAYGRMAEAESRREEKAARDSRPAAAPPPADATPPPARPQQEPEFPVPPASAKNWFLGDGRQWAAWVESGLPKGRYATWRRRYLDERMREMQAEAVPTAPAPNAQGEDEPEPKRNRQA